MIISLLTHICATRPQWVKFRCYRCVNESTTKLILMKHQKDACVIISDWWLGLICHGIMQLHRRLCIILWTLWLSGRFRHLLKHHWMMDLYFTRLISVLALCSQIYRRLSVRLQYIHSALAMEILQSYTKPSMCTNVCIRQIYIYTNIYIYVCVCVYPLRCICMYLNAKWRKTFVDF